MQFHPHCYVALDVALIWVPKTYGLLRRWGLDRGGWGEHSEPAACVQQEDVFVKIEQLTGFPRKDGHKDNASKATQY